MNITLELDTEHVEAIQLALSSAQILCEDALGSRREADGLGQFHWRGEIRRYQLAQQALLEAVAVGCSA